MIVQYKPTMFESAPVLEWTCFSEVSEGSPNAWTPIGHTDLGLGCIDKNNFRLLLPSVAADIKKEFFSNKAMMFYAQVTVSFVWFRKMMRNPSWTHFPQAQMASQNLSYSIFTQSIDV